MGTVEVNVSCYECAAMDSNHVGSRGPVPLLQRREIGMWSVWSWSKTPAYKPHELVWLKIPCASERLRLVQVISMPIPHDAGPETITVRMVPGEPTTMEEVKVSELRRLSFWHVRKFRWLHVAKVCGVVPFGGGMLCLEKAYLYDHNIGERDIDRMVYPRTLPARIYKVSDNKDPQWQTELWRSSQGCSLEPVFSRDLTTQKVFLSEPPAVAKQVVESLPDDALIVVTLGDDSGIVAGLVDDCEGKDEEGSSDQE